MVRIHYSRFRNSERDSGLSLPVLRLVKRHHSRTPTPPTLSEEIAAGHKAGTGTENASKNGTNNTLDGEEDTGIAENTTGARAPAYAIRYLLKRKSYKQSLASMREYQERAAKGEEPLDFLEQEWQADVSSVARRLNFLRSVYRAIQTLKRKPRGEKGRLAGLDLQASNVGSPMGLEDEHGLGPGPLASRLGLNEEDDLSSSQDTTLPRQSTRGVRSRVLPQ